MTYKLSEKEREELVAVITPIGTKLADVYMKVLNGRLPKEALEIVYKEGDSVLIGFIESLLAKKVEEALDTSKVTRVEVINGYERDYVNWKDDNKVTLEFQDDNKTLKIFMNRD